MHACLPVSIPDALTEIARQVDKALDQFTRFSAGCPDRLAQAIRYSLLAPGKRFRPALVLWSAEACGCTDGRAMPAACAVEMVHCYSLVHDDLPAMDDDDLRRGRPTLHRAFDEATAILAGDALLALAFEVLARHVRPASVAVDCCVTLATAAGPTSLIGGQMDDLGLEGGPAAGHIVESSDRPSDHPTMRPSGENDGELAVLQSIHERKTGAMIRASLQLGALVAQATPAQRAACDTFGRKLGIAFQIADDVLDVRGDEAALGKRIGKDQQHGKLTYPSLLGADESLRRATALAGEACEALALFGAAAGKLDALARYVVERNH